MRRKSRCSLPVEPEGMTADASRKFAAGRAERTTLVRIAGRLLARSRKGIRRKPEPDRWLGWRIEGRAQARNSIAGSGEG